ncbi:hypothetical protein FB550_102441 [Neobacillus bataviensis]|uniref:Uncharacterized protein n=1 Tax=Neobacillus bataviensis TaxID=220685 RepID=A0A561DSS5_9BACI|nr:hypothetical protein [Neobacillus bataviensis]TWE06419.1 hypothetical protein FB550_102441 [Neobacillus bataviensis]
MDYMLERMKELLNDPNFEFRTLMDDLLKKQAEYQDRIDLAKQMNDKISEKYYKGANEGITVALSSVYKSLIEPVVFKLDNENKKELEVEELTPLTEEDLKRHGWGY